MRAMRGFVLVILAAALTAVLPACDRTPKLVPADGDTTAAATGDSLVVYMRLAQRMWDAGVGDEAARLTAHVLRSDLGRRAPDAWEARARALLDSLNVGAEVRGAPCAVVANMFLRSSPMGASWPYAFWCAADSARSQAIEGAGMRLLQVAAREVKGAPEARGLAVLYGRHVPAGVQPTLMVWTSDASGEWMIAQSLGADSLGGMGTGRFETVDEATELVTETHRVSPGFQECPQCPHVERVLRFRWEGPGFQRISESVKPTPYAAFVRFIQSLRASDYVEAMLHVTDRPVLERAMNLGWARSREPWRLAPGMHGEASELVFLHGQRDAYRVWFEPRGERWVISSVDTTARGLEVE